MNILSQVQQLQRQIQLFQEIDKKKMSRQQLSMAIMQALTIDGQYGLPMKTTQYNVGTDLYRARKLRSTDLNLLWKWNKQDYWEVPTKFVTNFGRLNEPYESVFYASLDFSQTLNETHAVDGELVVISRFCVVKNFPSVIICPDLADAPMTEEERVLANVRNDFLRVEFTRDVAPGLEYLYKTSNQIVKDDFDLPEEASRAWTYPAIGNRTSINIAMRPSAVHQLLSFEGAVAGKAATQDGIRCIGSIVLIDSDFRLLHATDNTLRIIMPNLKKQK